MNSAFNNSLKVKGSGASGRKASLRVSTKAQAIYSIKSLPPNIQASAKKFFKGGSNAYNNFQVRTLKNGKTLMKMTKPGNVPGSRAVYYKLIDTNGKTLKSYKKTFTPDRKMAHNKDKLKPKQKPKKK